MSLRPPAAIRRPSSNVDGNSHELSRVNSDIGRNERLDSHDQVLLSNEWDKKEGWPVVAAGSAIFFVYLGLVYSYGIVQLHLADAHLASASTLSFIGSLGAAMSPLMGMIVARIIKRIGYRATAFIGSIFLGLGEFTAGWSTQSVPAMFATQGFLFGIGAAMLFLPAATVPSLWFKKKRGLATGLVYGGAGLGSAVIAISLEELISVTGLEGALKILGGLAWGICIPASYFLKAPAGSARAVSSIQCRVAASILAAWNFASALGRIGMGFGADIFLGPVNSMILSLTVIGVSAMALWPFASSLGLLIFFAIINGMGSGGFFSLMPVVVGAVFGDGQLANIMSMLSTSWTFGYFLGSPIAGYLLDAYGGTDAGLAAFRPAIFYAGSLTLASAGLLMSVRLMMNRKIFARV